MNKDEYLKERLESQIDWYDRKSISNQKWFKRLQVIIIFAAATIPFLSGYMDEDTLYLKLLIGVLGLAVATATSVLGLYQFQENWFEYRTSCETLRHEKYLFLTGAAPYDEDEPFLLLVERVEGLISKENTNWQSYMKQPADENKSNGA